MNPASAADIGVFDTASFHAWCNAADTTPALLYTARGDGSIEFVNAWWKHETGLNAAQLLDDAWSAVIDPRDLHRLTEQWQRAVATGERFQNEFRLRKSDGSFVWVLDSAVPVRDHQGTVVRWFGTVADVDRRHRDEKRDLALARAIIDATPLLVSLAHTDGSRFFFNQRWFAATGFEGSMEALSATWRDLIHPSDLPTMERAYQRGVECSEIARSEFRLRMADGEYRWFQGQLSPLADDDGAAQYFLITTQDVHDYRETIALTHERAEYLAQSEHRFRELAEAVPVIVWTADASGWIDWYNSRWYEYTGQTHEEAAGWGWQAAHHPEDFPRVMAAWQQSIEGGEPFELEFRLRRADGQWRTMLTRIIPIKNERGEIVRWYGSNVDVQAQRDLLDRTRQIAETFQQVFLPRRLPHTMRMRTDAVYRSAEKDASVGGDWYDAVELPDGRYLLTIGDVTGHGLDASRIANRLRYAGVDFALTTHSPADVLKNMNRVLRFQYPDVYASALVAFVDAACTSMDFASAGHPPPLHATLGEPTARELDTGGVLLGFLDDVAYSVSHVDVHEGDVIALFTDGVTEFKRDVDAAHAELSRIVASLVGTQAERPAPDALHELIGDTSNADDAALLIAQFERVTIAPKPEAPIADTFIWRYHASDTMAARQARHELMHFLREHVGDDEDGLFACESIIGEIVANTVHHAPGMVEIVVDWHQDRPVLTAVDSGGGGDFGEITLPEDELSERGRGLFLIERLAHALSVRSSERGAEFRVELPIVRQ